MSAPVNKWRRRFLIGTTAAAGGLVVGSWWFYRKRNMLAVPDSLSALDGESIFNAWLKINSDGRIVVEVPRQENTKQLDVSC